MIAATFTCNPAGDSYEVIDAATGRPVAVRDTHQSANGVAFVLNDAAKAGPKALAGAFARIRCEP